MPEKRTVFVTQHNHFDPIWRRCWDRSFVYKGKMYRSYADIEQMIFDIWIESAKKGAVFSEGQSVVVRKYLERRPEALPVLRDLVRRGLFEITGAGETVADTNMPSGETLLRNLAMGQWWFQDNFGVTPAVGWLEDAFGQSAQVPQIFRGCEIRHVVRLCYKRVPGVYWRGLDGSVVCTAEAPDRRGIGSCYKIPPCPECGGFRCEACGNTGFDSSGRIGDEDIRRGLNSDRHNSAFAHISVGGEEVIANPKIAELAAEANASAGGVDYCWGGWNDVARELRETIEKLDYPGIEVSDQVEANPVSTGCYVSRIKIKQAFRRIENKLVSAEKWATVGWLHGSDYPSSELTAAWRDLLFVAFHDAITSTHIDAAYEELMDMLQAAERATDGILDKALRDIEAQIDCDGECLLIYNSESWERNDPITVFLPNTETAPELTDAASGTQVQLLDSSSVNGGVRLTFRPPAVPALGYRVLKIEQRNAPKSVVEESGGPSEIENEFFRISVSDKGITSIVDKASGREILSTEPYLANELILEEDVGHPWGTQKAPEFEEKLSGYTTGVTVRRSGGVGEIIVTGEYAGHDRNVKELRWTQTTRLYPGSSRIDFTTEIDWDTAQRRIRVTFPTAIKTSEATYAVPYGAVKRGTYEPELDIFPSTNGDWPAVNWVDVYDEEKDWGAALLNQGTPSHKVENGVIFLSVLRSPTDSWCLNEPEHYDCPDFDGARDAGHHVFRYSFVPHEGDWREAAVDRLGREFNVPMVVRKVEGCGGGSLPLCGSFLRFDGTPNVVVSVIKKAQKDDSVVVRLAETDGRKGRATVGIEGTGGMQAVTNYLERLDQPIAEHAVEFDPFKVLTIRLAR